VNFANIFFKSVYNQYKIEIGYALFLSLSGLCKRVEVITDIINL